MVILTALVYGQILLGATMRHTGAGLAIPDFPLSYGRLLPPVWTTPIAIHFAHRVGALVVASVALANIAAVARRHGDRPELTRPAWLLATAIATQITLGAYVVLTAKQPIVNTLHVATGAIVFVTSLVLTLRLFRVRFARLGHAS
jgi:cytochrome c oxidase assembly protein subunit 15